MKTSRNMDCEADSFLELMLLRHFFGEDSQQTTSREPDLSSDDLDDALGFNDSFRSNQRRLSKNKTMRLNYPYNQRISGDGGDEALPSVHAIRYTISTFNDSHNGNNCTSSHKDNNVTRSIIIAKRDLKYAPQA